MRAWRRPKRRAGRDVDLQFTPAKLAENVENPAVLPLVVSRRATDIPERGVPALFG